MTSSKNLKTGDISVRTSSFHVVVTEQGVEIFVGDRLRQRWKFVAPPAEKKVPAGLKRSDIGESEEL